MLETWGLFLLGLVFLMLGGDSVVKGASGVARHYGLSPFVTGLVLVAFATSIPELVVNGRAAISNDRDRIKELWSPFAKAWWDSPEDPDIRVLTVTPERAEIWDAPGKIISAAVMLTAAVTGGKPAVGEHGSVRM